MAYVRDANRGNYIFELSSNYFRMMSGGYSYRIEGDWLYNLNRGYQCRVEGNYIRSTSRGYILELVGNMIRSVRSGYIAEIVSGNYIRSLDNSRRYYIEGYISKMELMMIIAVLFGDC